MSGVEPARYGHARRFLAGGFLLLALIVVMAVVFVDRVRTDEQWDNKNLRTELQLADVLSSVRQAETGQRGYLLTGNVGYLIPYKIAVAVLPGQMQLLQGLLAANGEAVNFATMQNIITLKMAELAHTIQLYDAGDKAGAMAVVNTNTGNLALGKLRNLTGVIQNELAVQLNATESEEARNGWILQVETAAAVLGTLLLGWFAIRDNRLRAAALVEAEASLIRANEVLEAKVEDRTRTLYASESQFRILAESLPGFVFMTDAKGAITYVNPQFAGFTGLTLEQVRGDGWVQALHMADAGPSFSAWQDCVARAAPYEREYRFRRHDGEYRWFIGRFAPIDNAAAGFVGWIGTCTDIHDRKQAETDMAGANAMLTERVAERSRELDRIFSLSNDILSVASFDGTFVSVSPAWDRIGGWPGGEILNRPFAEYIHPDDLEKTLAMFEKLKQGTQVIDFENRYRRADGSYCWLNWRAVPVVEEGMVYSIARDVTQEKAREEQLRQSQKMEVVGQLTGGIAHDFNNLLTIIMGSLEMLQRGLKQTDAKTIRRIDNAMDGAKRAAALTHRLLAFARRQALEPTAIEPNRLVAGMADMLSRVLGEHIALEFVSTAGLWRVQADVNQLENCVLNLAVNARDAMPDGGHLTIETQNVYLDQDYAELRDDVAPGQYAMIAVTDTGTGMEPEILEKVFEPFFTTKPQGQGTGLGLAQVYGFIKQSSGHVAIYSEPGHGTSVKLYFPRLLGDGREPRQASPAIYTKMESHGETLLVVEDEENVRNFAVEVLEEFGYSVLAAENASAALKLLEANPIIDMLFTDVVLTGTMNGRVLATEVLRQRPHMAVLFTTGYTRNAIIHHGRLDEGIDFIGKPFTALALTQQVRKILDRVKTSEPVK